MKYTVALISLLLLCSPLVYAQVGVDNTDPHPSSILDLAATDKGLLIPRMTSTQRTAITTPANSLLVFDTTVGKYYYYKDTEWFVVNEFTRTPGTSNLTYTGNVQVTGNVTAASFSGVASGAVPLGGIIMWNGSVASIPSGWALCNGANGTPDLRDRFIVGAGNSYAPFATGGQASVNLTVAQMPSHAHTINNAGSHGHTTTPAGTHSHTVNGGSHRHPFLHGRNGGIDSNANGGGWAIPSMNQITEYTQYDGGHTHSVSSAPDHGHTISAGGDHTHTEQSVGGNQAIDNRPPYYALAYIMRIL